MAHGVFLPLHLVGQVNERLPGRDSTSNGNGCVAYTVGHKNWRVHVGEADPFGKMFVVVHVG